MKGQRFLSHLDFWMFPVQCQSTHFEPSLEPGFCVSSWTYRAQCSWWSCLKDPEFVVSLNCPRHLCLCSADPEMKPNETKSNYTRFEVNSLPLNDWKQGIDWLKTVQLAWSIPGLFWRCCYLKSQELLYLNDVTKILKWKCYMDLLRFKPYN